MPGSQSPSFVLGDLIEGQPHRLSVSSDRLPEEAEQGGIRAREVSDDLSDTGAGRALQRAARRAASLFGTEAGVVIIPVPAGIELTAAQGTARVQEEGVGEEAAAEDHQQNEDPRGGPRLEVVPEQLAALCAETIAAGGPTAVEDVPEDNRGAEHRPAGKAPPLRFYAGTPIRPPNGPAVGTLSVVGSTPKRPSSSALARLEDMAEVAMGALENPEPPASHTQVRGAPLRSIAENVSEGLYRSTPESGLVYVNQAFAEMFGYQSPAEVLQVDPETLYAPSEDREQRLNALREKTPSEAPFQEKPSFTDHQVEFQREDGTTFTGLLNGTVVPGRERTIKYLDGAIRDVTEQIRRERALQHRSDAMEAATDGMAILDEEEVYTYVNQAHVDVYGYDSPEAFLGNTWRICYEGEELRRFEEEVMPALREEGTWRGEATGRRADGSRFPQELTLTQIEEGGIICVVRDITEQKETEWALRKERNRLDRFAGVLSHDLKNPLNVAQGRLALAQEEIAREEMGPEPDPSGHLAAVEDALGRMEAIIQDVLILTWSQQRVGPEEKTPCDLARMAEASWDNVETAGATLRLGDAPLLQASERRLQHLLENLFRNAVEHGRREVSVWVGGLDDGFYVEDDGTGIPEEKRAQVFEEGYSSKEEGTGLGLSIVKTIAEAHGWTLSVTEGRAGGARFEITGVESNGEAESEETSKTEADRGKANG